MLDPCAALEDSLFNLDYIEAISRHSHSQSVALLHETRTLVLSAYAPSTAAPAASVDSKGTWPLACDKQPGHHGGAPMTLISASSP